METFENVYRQHVRAVYECALSVAGRKESAEALTSEAFLALLRNFDGIDQSQLPDWLIAVVRNRAHYRADEEVAFTREDEDRLLARMSGATVSRWQMSWI